MAMVGKSGLIFASDTSIKTRSGQSGFKDLQLSPGFFTSVRPRLSPFSPSLQHNCDSLILDIIFHILSYKVKKRYSCLESFSPAPVVRFLYVETDGCYIAFKIVRTWVCLHCCASTAPPFRLSLFSLVIISYSSVPFLSLKLCLPSRMLVLPLYSAPFSSASFHPSSPQGCTGTPPCLYPGECRLIPSPPLPLLPHNLFSLLWKMHCWQLWENYLPVPLQRKVLRLNSANLSVAQPDHFNPQNKTPPRQ